LWGLKTDVGGGSNGKIFMPSIVKIGPPGFKFEMKRGEQTDRHLTSFSFLKKGKNERN
jgi:hypothetical protein